MINAILLNTADASVKKVTNPTLTCAFISNVPNSTVGTQTRTVAIPSQTFTAYNNYPATGFQSGFNITLTVNYTSTTQSLSFVTPPLNASNIGKTVAVPGTLGGGLTVEYTNTNAFGIRGLVITVKGTGAPDTKPPDPGPGPNPKPSPSPSGTGVIVIPGEGSDGSSIAPIKAPFQWPSWATYVILGAVVAAVIIFLAIYLSKRNKTKK
jgi:hypothetical protein